MVTQFYLKHKRLLDYIPFVLLALFLAAEADINYHAFSLTCQTVMTIIVIAIFFLIFSYLKLSRGLALFLVCIVWVGMVYIKNNHILQNFS